MSCTRAALTLLPKKGDLGLLRNWRPVALLCSDYKILSKCLANRLKQCMHTIVHRNQSYCIPARTIMDNIFVVRDVIELSKLNSCDLGLLSLDQEKAFDKVDHEYLFQALEAFAVERNFLLRLKMFYSEAFFTLKVGGGLSCPVKMGRGIRQGCPLSGQLYSLAIEPLLCRLRAELRGLSVSGAQEKLEKMMTVFYKKPE